MSLDFILASNKHESTMKKSALSLNEIMHLNVVKFGEKNDLSMLERIQDYYSDALYQEDEITKLYNELVNISEVPIEIKYLCQLCVEAQKQQLKIYVYSD